MFEPNLTGISYSFTGNGWYEEAYYRAISNRTSHVFENLSSGIALTELQQQTRIARQESCNGSTVPTSSTPTVPSPSIPLRLMADNSNQTRAPTRTLSTHATIRPKTSRFASPPRTFLPIPTTNTASSPSQSTPTNTTTSHASTSFAKTARP